jgi:lipopolysaccharide transport system ATP-binding protein
MEDQHIAVRACGVAKVYRLWGSPRDRLVRPLKRIFRSLLPGWMAKTGDSPADLHEFHALHDISFDIRRGESWGFIGANGSGKSTLLKIISGNLRPSAGTVEVDGKVAILSYGSGFNGEFTGRENIYIKGTTLGLNKKQLDERAKSIEEFADIGEFIDQPVKTYSSGMGARLGFAIMAHVDAEIMISDEALAVGDAFFVQKCMRHIRKFLKNGTFIFVSHSINDVMILCDHAVWLEHGRVVKMGSASEVCRAYLSSIERRNSEGFLAEKLADAAQESETGDSGDIAPVTTAISPLLDVKRSATKHISASADDLAALKDYYAPLAATDRIAPARETWVDVAESGAADALGGDEAATGGGKIFSVTLTDGEGKALTLARGGEIVCLAVRAVAEKPILRPILGFQLKNRMGLPLVAENTSLMTREQVIDLQPGEIVSARFDFVLPLLAVGEYVIRAGFADGVEDNNALLDVRHEALLLRCQTSGARHGLVGLPMLRIEMVRDGYTETVGGAPYHE